MKCLQQTPVRTSLLNRKFDLLWFIIFVNDPQIGHNIITIKLRFSVIFQNKKQTLMRWYCTVLVRYVFCTMPNGGTVRALLVRYIQSGICFILLYTVCIYILYTYVLQLIINSTMYTILPVCVLFFNFSNINAVYMYFYPD